MIEEIKILKLGATKKDHPYYCQYVNFTENRIRTCDGQVFVDINNPFDIIGDVNLFILDNILKNCDSPQIYQDGNDLKIDDGNFKTSLVIDDIEFPDAPELKDLEYIELNELYDILKDAIKFVGGGLYSYIYICNDCIIATDRNRSFFHKVNLELNQPIGVDKKILGALNENCRIGVKDHNTVAVYNNGMVRFQASLLNNYPKNKIIKFMNKSRVGIEKLCNVYPLQCAVNKISPMLMNEQSPFVGLRNKNKELHVYIDSITNGVSIMTINSEIEDEFEMSIDNTFLNGINTDYDVHICINEPDRLYLTNDISEIVLMGEEF